MGFALSDMTLTSSAFDHGGGIPKQHTGEGTDVSPALSWSGAPDGTASFALICHDPDAPLISPGNYGFVHWVLYGIPGSVSDWPRARQTTFRASTISATAATVARCRPRGTGATITSSGYWHSMPPRKSSPDSQCGSCSRKSSPMSSR